MGNKQTNYTAITKQQQNYQKFITIQKDQILQPKKDRNCHEQNCFVIEQFQCLNPSSQKNKQKQIQIEVRQKTIYVTKYYGEVSNLQIYISNVIKMSKMLNIVLYDQIKFVSTQSPFTSIISININRFNLLDSQFIRRSTLEKKISLLEFVAFFLRHVKNIYIRPQFIIQGSLGFHLLDFSTTDKFTPEEIFLGFVRWIFGDNSLFQICLSLQEMPANMPIYLQQIYNQICQSKNLEINQLERQLKIIKDKMFFLLSKTDSFYACKFYNKIQKYLNKCQWIFMKSKHEIFFYQIDDHHSFMGKLIRKKKKKDVDQCHITFDPEELEILYVPENCKFIVKAAQFQFQSFSSISDIEIKYKLPVKFKNCLITRTRNGELLLLEQYLYRFVPAQNKLIQQTKRISDYIFLASTRQSAAFIVKLSIDIFRNGIRVFYKDQDIILGLTGDEKIISEISTIRVDIRQVIFCIQVYRGVFLMMASKNMWVLDLNFQCFFSYATPAQLKKIPTLTQHNNCHSDNKQNDQLFSIIDQPFKVDFNSKNNGNNATIKNNLLHILGYIQGHPYYLRYKFIQRIGALKLLGYHPLFVESPFLPINMKKQQNQVQYYKFNFHEENSNTYKYQNWILKGKVLVKVFDFKIRFEKNNYQVILQIQKLQQNLKQHIEKLSKGQKKPKKTMIILLLYKVFQIFEYLLTHSITHRNISINHICFTGRKDLKLHGWSQPPRNWHVSDFKDFMLVCFNIITCNTYEKLSEKIIQKHENQLNQFPAFSQKIHQAFKQSKTIQKHAQIQKYMQVLKTYFDKQLSSVLHQIKTDKFIFSFEYNTPRMTMFNTETQKLKKISIISEENNIAQQFTFNQTDKYIWNEQTKKLHIFTVCHHFYELKINTENMAEQKLILEDYQYLPQNVSSSTFILVQGIHLYSFGGVKKQIDGRSTYCKNVYRFNWKTLAWDNICQLPQARINPHAVSSSCKNYVYLIGGCTEHECQHLKLIKYDIKNNKCNVMIDKSSPNILSNLGCFYPMKIFHLSQQLGIFMFWSLQQGNYLIKYISYTSLGFQIEIKVKNYSNQNLICPESVSIEENYIHILRPYGKYTKITIQKLESAIVKNDTIYAI